MELELWQVLLFSTLQATADKSGTSGAGTGIKFCEPRTAGRRHDSNLPASLVIQSAVVQVDAKASLLDNHHQEEPQP